MYIYKYIHICICMYVCIYVCMYVCMYVYMYIYRGVRSVPPPRAPRASPLAPSSVIKIYLGHMQYI